MANVAATIKGIVNELGSEHAALLQVLLAAQDASPENYVSEEAVNEIACLMGATRSRVYSTASFYSAISLRPRGRHIIRVCINAPCENAGKEAILAALTEELGIGLGQTTADGLFTLEGVSCLGACYMSPAIKIDKELYGDLTPAAVVAIVRRYGEEAGQVEYTA
jgi:NADH-quinone oxidoreductase subunit E